MLATTMAFTYAELVDALDQDDAARRDLSIGLTSASLVGGAQAS